MGWAEWQVRGRDGLGIDHGGRRIIFDPLLTIKIIAELSSQPCPIAESLQPQKMTPPPARQSLQRPFFISDCILNESPSHCWQSFKYPVLRRCRFEPDTINWRSMVGNGSEGCVFRVRFGSEGPFAVKIVCHHQRSSLGVTSSLGPLVLALYVTSHTRW